jgi:tight adherence protein C
MDPMRLVYLILVVVAPIVISARELARAPWCSLPLLLVIEAIYFAVSVFAWDRLSRRHEIRTISRNRALEERRGDEPQPPPREPEELGALTRWLALAGYRAPGAAETFVGLTVAATVVGIAVVIAVRRSGILETGLQALEQIPGAVGEVFWVPLQLGPWIILAILSCLPWLVVRAARRRLVTEVERDLPLVLELLATLSESGIGFDAALARVVAAQPPERPLTAEFRTFQRETLTGRSRVDALRRLARRVDVPSLTIFLSAVIQAEQVGSGVSDVLRHQADDVRDRRRDRALNLAQSLPVKLLFPLVICCLPAIFVLTLGPIFLQFIQMADTLVNRGTPK